MQGHLIGLTGARAARGPLRGQDGLRTDRPGADRRWWVRRGCGRLHGRLGAGFDRIYGGLQAWLGGAFRGRRNVVALGDMIGAGSFAVVYRGTLVDGRGRRRRVAVKFAKNTAVAMEAIRNEIATLAAVPPHRNVVDYERHPPTVLDGGRLGNWVANDQFIVMELGGATLEELLHPAPGTGGSPRGPLAYRQWLPIFRDVADGLAHLEAHGVTHFDVKPCNVLIGAGLGAKLLDFGCSRVGPQLSTQPFRHGGTCAYLPPECQLPVQFSVGRPVSKVDVYSLGVIMWEAIAGRKREAPFVSGGWYELGAAYPEALRRLINDCLEYDPQARPSCQEISRQLGEMMALDWVHAVPCGGNELLDLGSH